MRCHIFLKDLAVRGGFARDVEKYSFIYTGCPKKTQQIKKILTQAVSN